MGWAVAYLMMIPLWPLFALWRGYAISLLWGWFVAPTFGLSPLSIHAAIGLMLVMGAIKSVDYQRDDREASEKLGWSLAIGILGPGLMIGTGWVWKWLQWGM